MSKWQNNLNTFWRNGLNTFWKNAKFVAPTPPPKPGVFDMLLVEFTINGTLNRLSNENLALAHEWKQKVMTFTAPKYIMRQRYGGYVESSFGQINFFPDLFDGDWPPPTSGELAIKYTSSTEASAEVLFNGTAYIDKIDRKKITYNIFGPTFSTTVGASTAFSATTLNAAMATLTGASQLNLTLDTTLARNPSPTINHTTSKEQLSIDLASGFCEYLNHLFYIKDTTGDGVLDTLYLVDLQLDNGTRTATEFDFFPSTYKYNKAFSLVRDSVNGYISQTSFPFGSEISVFPYDTNQTNIENALDDIRDTLLKPRRTLKIPLEGDLPEPGEQITDIDESQAVSTTMVFNSRNLTYDFDKEVITVEGEGIISAT